MFCAITSPDTKFLGCLGLQVKLRTVVYTIYIILRTFLEIIKIYLVLTRSSERFLKLIEPSEKLKNERKRRRLVILPKTQSSQK